MPIGNQIHDDGQIVKLLLVGDSKTGKTHYAMQAAVDGFKVLYFDGDMSRPTIMQFSPEVRSRLFYLPFNDSIAETGQYIPRFSLLVKKFLSEGSIMWNDTQSRVLIPSEDDGCEAWELNLSHLTSNWVLVIDSWTAVAHSVMSVIAMRNHEDLSDMEKASRGLYASANNMATDFLHRLRNLPCHVIVIAHPDEYVKYKNRPGSMRDNAKDPEVEYTKLIPRSVSRPHGTTLPAYFSDVGWMEVSPAGRRMVNFEPSDSRSAGGRFDKRLSVQDAAFARIVEHAGGSVPHGVTNVLPDAALTHYPKWQAPVASKPIPSVVNPNGPPAVSIKGVTPMKLKLELNTRGK